MSRKVQLGNGNNITLELMPFASGGEGDLFRITAPLEYTKLVAKLYKQEKRNKQREDKILFLSSNKPASLQTNGHQSLIWINQVLYENGKFCGFTMPIAQGQKLELLCHPKLPSTLTSDWLKFDFQSPQSMQLRLKLCFNISVALYQVHRLNKYILIDMKPDNIMVQSNGLISLIDIDSVAVVQELKTIFPAPVATPEYSPPEYYSGLKPDIEGAHETWDRFSLAVIFYRLLCGIHPFTGSCNSPYERCNGLADMVKNGLFPNGKKSIYFKVIPPPHSFFKKLQAGVQSNFIKCFDDGYSNPSMRPSADDWCKILSPTQSLQINRILPSSITTFPKYIFTTGLRYNPSTNVDINHINYSNLKKRNSFQSFFDNLFGKSAQAVAIEKVIKKEEELKNLEMKFLTFAKELELVVQDFQNAQQLILVEEINKIKHLQSVYDKEMNDFDLVSKNLQKDEVGEIKKIIDSYSSLIAEFDGKINFAYNRILSEKYTAHETQKSTLRRNRENTEHELQMEMNRQIKDSNKLTKYRISNAVISNFGVTIKRNLELAGITSAADFIDIDGDGRFLKSSGGWAKAYNVGLNRAAELLAWKRELERRENQSITISVKLTFQSKLSILQNSLNNLEVTFKRDIQPYQQQYERETKNLQDLKTKHIENYKLQQTTVTKKYDSLHHGLKFKIKEYLEVTLQDKMTKIAFDIDKDLNNNFQEKMSLFGDKKREIKEFTDTFASEGVKLQTLQSEIVNQ